MTGKKESLVQTPAGPDLTLRIGIDYNSVAIAKEHDSSDIPLQEQAMGRLTQILSNEPGAIAELSRLEKTRARQRSLKNSSEK